MGTGHQFLRVIRFRVVPKKRSSTWLLLFVIYFLVHALIRTALGGSFTEDEWQIMTATQNFAWLYDGQMPLYAWAQSAVNDMFGPTVISATILKNTILLLICFTVFTLVERVSNTSYAFAATISLLFLPQLAWTSQHGLTAPVLATLFAATTLLSFSRLSEERTFGRYGVLGAMIGLGAVSSTTYLLVPAALIPAALTSPAHRKIVLNKRMAVTALIAIGLAAKPYHVLYLTGATVLPDFSEIYPLSMNLVLDRATGMYGVLQTALTFAGLLIVGAAITVYAGLGRNLPVNAETASLRELLLRTVSIGFLIIFGIAFVNGGAWMDQANLQPLLFLTAPVLALYLFPAMSTTTHRQAVKVAGVIATAILLVTPAHYSFGGRLDNSTQQAFNAPSEPFYP